MKIHKILIFSAFAALLISCATFIPVDDIDPNPRDFYFLSNSSDRITNQKHYFQHECQQRDMRRSKYGFSQDGPCTDNIIGLALSGGGMRSAAFQLGLLSGLHKTPLQNLSLLNRIDYVSSVSGGGWANGAYWASNQGDSLFFKCLDELAQDGKADVSVPCKPQEKMLRFKQEVDVLATEQRKITWENDIIKFYLPDCNIEFADQDRSRPCWNNYSTKPYPIFNSTHSIASALAQNQSIDNLPFEMTLDYLGTIYDCDKSRECKPDDGTVGFFVKANANDFVWSNRKRPGKFMFLNLERIPGTPLSKAMAHSSGVVSGVPVLFEYNFDLRHKGSYIEGLRKIYKLSDGGKTENLGLVPLIERGSDLIIVSYMGKDEDPINDPFEDLNAAKQQVKKLLNCDVKVPGVDTEQFILTSSYQCGNGGKRGTIIHVKPSHRNVTGFLQYLKTKSWGGGLVKYLEAERANEEIEKIDWFPQTQTMKMEYDEELVRAYYLFGQYIAENHLGLEIMEWLENRNT